MAVSKRRRQTLRMIVESRGFVVLDERACSLCQKAALCLLPIELLIKQTDGTIVVCHPLLGGCNHGFGV